MCAFVCVKWTVLRLVDSSILFCTIDLKIKTKQQWNGYKFGHRIDRRQKKQYWVDGSAGKCAFNLAHVSCYILAKTSRWSRAKHVSLGIAFQFKIHLNRLVMSSRPHSMHSIRTVAKSFCSKFSLKVYWYSTTKHSGNSIAYRPSDTVLHGSVLPGNLKTYRESACNNSNNNKKRDAIMSISGHLYCVSIPTGTAMGFCFRSEMHVRRICETSIKMSFVLCYFFFSSALYVHIS